MISLRGAVFFIYLGILFVIALVDWHIQMIYDRFHIMILILAVLDFMLYPKMGIATRLTGMGIISVPMLVLALAIPGAFGGGDIKLMAVIGFFLGWKMSLTAFMLAVFSGGIYGIGLLLSKKKGAKEHFAFGPFLCAGTALTLFVGEWLLSWYLSIIF